MKKKILVGLLVLASVVGIVYAEQKVCQYFDNSSRGGIYVTVSSERVQKKDNTVAEYDNTITVMSNGNKMRVIECTIKYGRSKNGTSGQTGYILEEYGSHTEIFRTAERPLTADKIYVKAEGCN